jgi:xanthine dehydrogenase YagT iron-sulfur-binding subunit
MSKSGRFEVTRRELLIVGAASVTASAIPLYARTQAPGDEAPVGAPVIAKVSLEVNGQSRALELDTRTTLLDALREHLHLTGKARLLVGVILGASCRLPSGRGSKPSSRRWPRRVWSARPV